MKPLSLIAATAVLGLAAYAYANPPQDQYGATQPTPAEQPAAPSTMPSTEQPATAPSSTDPPSGQAATTQSNTAAGPSSPLETHLAAIAPAGMSTQEACTGFRSVTECATALHASQNLNIPYADLKSKVTGGKKLGAAIKELKPGVDAKAEVRKAEKQARADITGTQG